MKKIAIYSLVLILILLFLFNSFVIYQALFQSSGCSFSAASGPSGGGICDIGSFFFLASMMGLRTGGFMGVAVALLLLNLYIGWIIFMVITSRPGVYRLANTITPYFKPLSRKAFLGWLIIVSIILPLILTRIMSLPSVYRYFEYFVYVQYFITLLFIIIQLRRFADFNNNGKWFLMIWVMLFILNILLYKFFSPSDLLTFLGNKTTYSIVMSIITRGTSLFPIFINLVLLFYPGIPKENQIDAVSLQQEDLHLKL